MVEKRWDHHIQTESTFDPQAKRNLSCGSFVQRRLTLEDKRPLLYIIVVLRSSLLGGNFTGANPSSPYPSPGPYRPYSLHIWRVTLHGANISSAAVKWTVRKSRPAARPLGRWKSSFISRSHFGVATMFLRSSTHYSSILSVRDFSTRA